LKILITGAGGFLGSYLARHLQYDVIALTRQELDLSDAEATHNHFRHNRYDAVIHCGAAGRNTPWAEDRSIVNSNLLSVMNLMSNSREFDTLINIGTGAEFDISQPIDCARESDVFTCSPQQSYGMSKNLISRCLRTHPMCYNLRLFGCFDSSEDNARLLKKLHSSLAQGDKFSITDREFDMISAEDFTTVVNAVLNGNIIDRDINCVYAEKHTLGEILGIYCDTHNLDKSLIEVTGQGMSYTGNGDKLEKYKLPLLGLRESLARY